jgi:hypothetical protein
MMICRLSCRAGRNSMGFSPIIAFLLADMTAATAPTFEERGMD